MNYGHCVCLCDGKSKETNKEKIDSNKLLCILAVNDEELIYFWLML